MPEPAPVAAADPGKSLALGAFRAFMTTVSFQCDIDNSWELAPPEFRAAWEAAVQAVLAECPGEFVITVRGGRKLAVPAGLVYEDRAEAIEIASNANHRAELTGREAGYGVARIIPIQDENEETTA
ncbi:MAG: hypothetical protein JWO67_6387 [Streptosporangiaceae bacterium]|nr:hypothetical protein [Streptosporangiaceae bacterium]